MLLTHMKSASIARNVMEASNINSEFARIVAANEAAMFNDDSANVANDSTSNTGVTTERDERSRGVKRS